MEKKTFGQRLIEHDNLKLDMEDDVIEYRKQMEPAIIENIYKAAREAKKDTLYKNKDFYVELRITMESLAGVPNFRCFARRSCPTPATMQSVWKFHHVSDTFEFLWSLPSAILCNYIQSHPDKYLVDKETSELAKFVLLERSGELLEWVKKENGEKKDAVIRINKESV